MKFAKFARFSVITPFLVLILSTYVMLPHNHDTSVPIVTSENTGDMNEKTTEDALAETERARKEPFYSLYREGKFSEIRLEGTIRATSPVPDPLKNDYDNCLYTVFVEIDSLLSEVTPDTEISNEIIVTIPIMKNKKILQDYRFLPGDKIRCTCSEYDAMPQKIQEIQISDTIQSYEHQQYYPFEITGIDAFSKGGNRAFAKRKITVLPVQSLPKDTKAASLRKERMQAEIVRIEAELQKHGGTFAAWRKEYKTISEKYIQLCKDGYQGWINDSYFAAGGGETSYKTKAYIDGILPYKKYLEENNIDLIVVRIPSKYDFAVRVLASDHFEENPAWMEHYYECLKNDIEIIDPMPEMWKHRADFPLFYFYNASTESHPFEGQAFISAKVISDALKDYSYPKSEQQIELEDYVHKTTQPRYFWPAGNEKFNPKDNVRFKRVVRDKTTVGGLAVNTGSPFVFLSNSYFWYPLRDQGASVPGYTAYFLQHIPDWFYQSGIGNPMLRNLITDSQVLANRKAVIMVGHPNDWRNTFPAFPKYLSDHAQTISLESTLDFLSSAVTNLDDGSFLFSKDEDGATLFTQNKEKENANKSFRIKFTVPYIEDKSSCMLRINFGTNSYITTDILDAGTEELIDQTTISPGTNQHTDFYIPLSSESRSISVEFKPAYAEHKYSVKNIELWYY